MRDHSKHIEVTRDEAIELLLGAADYSSRIEEVALEEAFGRVLAVDAKAQLDMPNCLTCCMDSVAVHWDDFANGMPDTSAWVRGNQWEFANTGIGMPEGFDTAIVIEHVVLSDDEKSISFDAMPSARYAGTRPAGSKMHDGDVLVSAGETLTPLLVSHIASGGNSTVQVYARPRVAFIPTGNELVSAGDPLPRGKNYESNSLLIRGKIAAWGGEPIVFDIVPDNQELIKEAILKAVRMADIVIVNAGSSKGSDDWNVEMLDEVGEVLYHQTNHGPGHHSSGSVVEGVPVVGISGPPGGAAFTTDFYLLPLMRKYFGQETGPTCVSARMRIGFPAKKRGGKPDTAPRGEARPSVVREGSEFFGIKQVRLSLTDDGVLEATPLSGSHPDAPEANTADAYYLLSSTRDENPPAAGEFIDVELRPHQL